LANPKSMRRYEKAMELNERERLLELIKTKALEVKGHFSAGC
jgi:hypothetical protein